MFAPRTIRACRPLFGRTYTNLPLMPERTYSAHGYHLIIYRFRPIFADGAKKACNGR
jgi:hypothetical protein